MANWVRSIRQTTTYLGVAVIALIWGGIYLLTTDEHERAYRDALRQGNNLTRVLEEYISRVFQQSDSALLALRRSYQKDPDHFDIARWVARTQTHKKFTVQYGIAGPDGFVKQSSKGPLFAPVYVGDRAHFVFQITDSTDQLYIGAPITGRISRRLAIELTRRVSKPDGSFDGVVVTSLDLSQLETFFSSLEIGHGGVVSLVRLDGVLLARGGPDGPMGHFDGLSITASPLFDALRQSPAGSYWNSSASSARLDGISRLMFYRVVPELPIVAVVGLTKQSIFEQADATRRVYFIAGTALTLMVLAAMMFGAMSQARILSTKDALQRSSRSLEQANSSLEHANILLQTALHNMAHGLCMFDRNQCLVICNERYGEMYNLAPERTTPGTSLRAILEAQNQRRDRTAR